MKTVRIGTRKSALALEQARLVAEGVRALRPGFAYDLVGYTTSGDRIQDRPLDEVGGKGLFVRELDRALLDGEVDIAVHSMKDLPSDLTDAVRIAALSRREDPADVLVLPRDEAGRGLPGMPGAGDLGGLAAWMEERGLAVGCSSARRRVQLLRLEPSLPVRPVRGNVNTRLEKLDRGEYGALVLAAAGLKRLGLEGRVDRAFTCYEMVPSAGQGVMAVTARADRDLPWLEGYGLQGLDLQCCLAERAFVCALGGNCATPCGAIAVREGGRVRFRGFLAAPDGSVFQECDEALDIDAGAVEQVVSWAEGLAWRLRDQVARAL